MMSLNTALLFFFVVFLVGSATADPTCPQDDLSTSNQTLVWNPCADIVGPDLGVQCATVAVPIDYFSNSSSPKRFNIELARVPAASGKSKGSIIVNFGGPGATGRDNLAALSPALSVMSGREFDLISFDPRATSNKTLGFSCFAFEEDRKQLVDKYPILLGNSSDTTHGYLWSMADIFLGTAYVARDMMQIVDSLQEDAMLRYWGFSYGTVLGAVAAAIFPDKIERLVLNEVLNPHEYYHGFEDEEVNATDTTWTGFGEGCLAAGPSHRALASRNATAANIQASVYTLLDTIKYQPLIYSSSILIDYTSTKSVIATALYSPSDWPGLAAALDAMLSGNLDSIKMKYLIITLLASSSVNQLLEAHLGIKCGDKIPRYETFESMEQKLRQSETSSRLLDDLSTGVKVICARWKMAAKERYEGDFRVETHNPALIMGNTYDPLTPLVSAKNVSAGLSGSVLLEHKGFGHSSMAQPSACTISTLAAYFVNRTLPEKGTVCIPDVPILMDNPSKTSVSTLQTRSLMDGSHVAQAFHSNFAYRI